MSAADERVEKWWPASGSCREDCPHEIAKRKRDADRDAHIEAIRNDPEVLAQMAQFSADMETLQAGGVEADQLRRKWYDENSGANLRLLMRSHQETAEWRARALAAERIERGPLPVSEETLSVEKETKE